MCHLHIYAKEILEKKKKNGAYKDEVALEPALELSSYERGGAEVIEVEVVEAELVDFNYDYANDEDEGTF